MANEVLQKNGTAVVFADTTDYSSTVSSLTRTDQIDLTSVASAAARQSAQADFGATRARQYKVMVGIEYAVAPASGVVCDFYLAPSPSITAANANPGGVSGSDAAYTGTAGDSLADSLKQLDYIGSLVLTADATTTVQYGSIGMVSDTTRYNSIVVVNNGGQALVSDAVEMYVAFVPVIDEVQ